MEEQGGRQTRAQDTLSSCSLAVWSTLCLATSKMIFFSFPFISVYVSSNSFVGLLVSAWQRPNKVRNQRLDRTRAHRLAG